MTVNGDGTITVSAAGADGQTETLTYAARSVIAPDGTEISGVSAWATSVGDLFVEVSHLGDGPVGGELVMVVTDPATGQSVVALGDLVTADVPETVPASWAAAVELAVGLIVDETLDSGSKEDVEDFHQQLLGVMHAGWDRG